MSGRGLNTHVCACADRRGLLFLAFCQSIYLLLQTFWYIPTHVLYSFLQLFEGFSQDRKTTLLCAMATEVSGENYDSLLKEMETLKGRLDEERLKLNDVACMKTLIYL